MTAATVRRARPADLPVIGRLGALLIEEHHAFDARRFLAPWPRTRADYAAYLGTQIDEPQAVVLVAEADGVVVGYAYSAIEGHDYMALRGPAGVLHDVIVDPVHRGHGFGRLLLENTLAELKAHGVPRVVLFTAVPNASAQRVFARAGFRPTMIEMTREIE